MKKGFLQLWAISTLIFHRSLSSTTDSPNQEDVIRSKYLGHQRLKKFFEDQTMFKFMATILTNLLKNQPAIYHTETYDCLKTANSKRTYAQCVAPVILRHRGMTQDSGSRGAFDTTVNNRDNIGKKKKRSVVRRRKKIVKTVSADVKISQNKTETHRRVYKVKRRKHKGKVGTIDLNGTKTDNPAILASLDDNNITMNKIDKQKIKVINRIKKVETTPMTKESKSTLIPEGSIATGKSFTLAPAEDTDKQSSTDNPTMQKIGELLVGMVQNIKKDYGSWFKFPDIDYLLSTGNVSFETNTFRHLNSSTKQLLNPVLNQVYGSIDHLLNSKLIRFKDSVDLSQEKSGQLSFNVDSGPDETVHVLSPRFMPMAAKEDGRPSVLSPDVMSLYEGGDNNYASLPDLMSGLGEHGKKPWLDFFSEISGSADIVREMQSIEFEKILARSNIDTGDGVSLSINSTFQFMDHSIGSIYKMLNLNQVDNLNSKGYAYLDGNQLDNVYGKEKKSILQFNIDHFLSVDENQRDAMIIDEILRLAYPVGRSKRQNAPPCILMPYLGGTTLITYLLAPQIICPSVFSFIILGPLVLSPYILSPYVFGPFILSPEVLTPFILSPYVLSPTILTPVVLSPSVLNPIVLSPYILSPFVLSPSILSPTVLSPNILSPGVLGPSILSPVVLGPNILSPSVLNPSILSPSVLSPAILSPGVLNPSILSPGVLNHGVLSPAVKSPSILSPCFLCKRRRKRDIFLQWFISWFKYEP